MLVSSATHSGLPACGPGQTRQLLLHSILEHLGNRVLRRLLDHLLRLQQLARAWSGLPCFLYAIATWYRTAMLFGSICNAPTSVPTALSRSPPR